MADRTLIAMNESGKALSTAAAFASPYLKYAKEYLFTPEIGYYAMEVPCGEDLTADFQTADSPFGIIFCLNGSSLFRFTKNGLTYEYSLKQGEYSFSYLPNVTGVAEIDSGIKYHAVNMFIVPFLFRNLTCGSPIAENFLNEITYISKTSIFLYKTEITKEISKVLHDLTDKNNPVSNPRSAKVCKLRELIMHTFKKIASERNPKSKSTLQPEDIEMLKNAGRIINENLSSPPSLVSLAKASGLNSFKLKIGFKEVFGTTVYGYIKEKRMEKAKDMLESGDFSVSDTAWDLGYTNVSHFIELFRRHYGITPGKFLSTKRNILTSSLISNARRNII